MRYNILFDHDYSQPIGKIDIDDPIIELMLDREYAFELTLIKQPDGKILGLNISARIGDEQCSECHGMALRNNLERPCHNCHSYHSGFYPPEICVQYMRELLYDGTDIPVSELSDEEVIKVAYLFALEKMEKRNGQ